LAQILADVVHRDDDRDERRLDSGGGRTGGRRWLSVDAAGGGPGSALVLVGVGEDVHEPARHRIPAVPIARQRADPASQAVAQLRVPGHDRDGFRERAGVARRAKKNVVTVLERLVVPIRQLGGNDGNAMGARGRQRAVVERQAIVERQHARVGGVEIPGAGVAVPIEVSCPRDAVCDSELLRKCADHFPVIGTADRPRREVEAAADDGDTDSRVSSPRDANGLEQCLDAFPGVHVAPEHQYEIGLVGSDARPRVTPRRGRVVGAEADERRRRQDHAFVLDVRIVCRESRAMRAAQQDDPGAVPQQGPEQAVHAPGTGPQRHRGAHGAREQ